MSHFSISDGQSRPFADVDIQRLSGLRGLGFYRLGALIEFSVRALEYNGIGAPAWLDDIAITMLVEGKEFGRLRPTPSQSRVEPYTGAGHKTQVSLECDLDLNRLAAIEDVRNGRDLQLNCAIAASISTSERPRFPAHHTASYLVTQSDWNRVLDEMGYRKTILLELMVEPSVSPGLGNAATTLGTAQQKILQGHFVEAVRDCRVALDMIGATLGDATMKPGGEVRMRTKHERYLAVRQSIQSLASPAHHGDPNAASIEYHRSDALAILAMTAAVLRAVAEPDVRP